MHRIMIGASSLLAILAMSGVMPTSGLAHEGSRLCNVILDGDGEPVQENDDDTIAHANSTACPEDDAAEVDDDEEEVQTTAAVEAPPEPEVVVEPLVVYFDVNKDDLDAGSRAEVDAYVTELMASPPSAISVVGYTDTSGPADLNAKLSEARANSVAAALIEAGVPTSLIARSAAGEDNLAVGTPDDTREANNRRVTITPAY